MFYWYAEWRVHNAEGVEQSKRFETAAEASEWFEANHGAEYDSGSIDEFWISHYDPFEE